jgi:hypothetical protein
LCQCVDKGTGRGIHSGPLEKACKESWQRVLADHFQQRS